MKSGGNIVVNASSQSIWQWVILAFGALGAGAASSGCASLTEAERVELEKMYEERKGRTFRAIGWSSFRSSPNKAVSEAVQNAQWRMSAVCGTGDYFHSWYPPPFNQTWHGTDEYVLIKPVKQKWQAGRHAGYTVLYNAEVQIQFTCR